MVASRSSIHAEKSAIHVRTVSNSRPKVSIHVRKSQIHARKSQFTCEGLNSRPNVSNSPPIFCHHARKGSTPNAFHPESLLTGSPHYFYPSSVPANKSQVQPPLSPVQLPLSEVYTELTLVGFASDRLQYQRSTQDSRWLGL